MIRLPLWESKPKNPDLNPSFCSQVVPKIPNGKRNKIRNSPNSGVCNCRGTNLRQAWSRSLVSPLYVHGRSSVMSHTGDETAWVFAREKRLNDSFNTNTIILP